MHSHPEAIAAQETYLHGLVKHVNPYTGLAYKDDPSIVGFEINNEPCHSGTKKEVKAYINRMLKAINKTGNRKPVFYNVSHNGYVVEAYYETAIQGTTYQWYPIGLVSGQTQQGNFLPYIDRYDIPFSNKVKDSIRKHGWYMSSIRQISCILICIRPWYALSVQQVFNGLPSLRMIRWISLMPIRNIRLIS